MEHNPTDGFRLTRRLSQAEPDLKQTIIAITLSLFGGSALMIAVLIVTAYRNGILQ